MESETPPPAADPSDPDERPEPGWHTSPPTLRRIDWLAVAPWTLLLGVPSVAVAFLPLVAGLMCRIVLCDEAAPVASLGAKSVAMAAWRAAAMLEFSSPLRCDSAHQFVDALEALLIAAYAACAAARWGAARLAGGSGVVSTPEAVRFALCRTHNALLALSLIAVPGLLLLGVGRLVGSFVPDEQGLAQLLGDLLLVGPCSLAGFAACLIAFVAGPLIIVAVAVDDADSFDAASRGVAYVTQQPLLALFCVVATLLITCAGGLIVETLLAGYADMRDWMFGTGHGALIVHENAGLAGGLVTPLLRSFYPASWILGSVGTYLVLRHSIDGQPLDEIAEWKGDQSQ